MVKYTPLPEGVPEGKARWNSRVEKNYFFVTPKLLGTNIWQRRKKHVN